MQSTNAKYVINAVELAFKTHGYLQYLRSDNEQPFAFTKFQEYLTIHGIVQVKGMQY